MVVKEKNTLSLKIDVWYMYYCMVCVWFVSYGCMYVYDMCMICVGYVYGLSMVFVSIVYVSYVYAVCYSMCHGICIAH